MGLIYINTDEEKGKIIFCSCCLSMAVGRWAGFRGKCKTGFIKFLISLSLSFSKCKMKM